MKLSDHLKIVVVALRGLSTLGRVQIFILVFNLFMTALCINIYAHHIHQALDWTTLSFGIEFFVFSLISIAYTLAVENEFAFWALVFLQFEAVAFSTAIALVGVLTYEKVWLRATIVAVNWVALVGFLILQRGLRQSWGWHAFQVAGSNPKNVSDYHRYQQLAAAVFSDMFHSVFFLTCEEVIVANRSAWQTSLQVFLCVLTVGLARPLILAVRHGNAKVATIIFVVHCLTASFYVFVCISNLISVVDGDVDVTDDGGNLPSSAQRDFIVVIEVTCVLVRLFFLATFVRIGSLITSAGVLENFFPTTNFSYLINDEQISLAHRGREGSVAGSGTHIRGDVKIYDATAKHRPHGGSPKNSNNTVSVPRHIDEYEEAEKEEEIVASYDMLPSIRDLS